MQIYSSEQIVRYVSIFLVGYKSISVQNHEFVCLLIGIPNILQS